MTDPKRLEAIKAKYTPSPDTGCWLWLGATNGDGYGLAWDGSKARGAHRVLYEALRGKIPHGLVLDHKCRVRCCVNPDHLEPVTNKENIMRGAGACAKNALKTHCRNGHEFTQETMLHHRHYRACRICRNQSRIEKRRNASQEKPND